MKKTTRLITALFFGSNICLISRTEFLKTSSPYAISPHYYHYTKVIWFFHVFVIISFLLLEFIKTVTVTKIEFYRKLFFMFLTINRIKYDRQKHFSHINLLFKCKNLNLDTFIILNEFNEQFHDDKIFTVE